MKIKNHFLDKQFQETEQTYILLSRILGTYYVSTIYSIKTNKDETDNDTSFINKANNTS